MAAGRASSLPTLKASFRALHRLDIQFSRWIHAQSQASGIYVTGATVFTLLADEISVFPILSFGAFLCLYLSASEPWEMFARRTLRMFGDVGAVGLFEQVSKSVFRRSRPNWVKRNTFYCMPAEWWSFPSGHAMRAGYLAVVVSGPTSPLSFLYPEWMRENESLISLTLLVLAIGVCWSRVALGKHFALDVAAGLAIGVTCGNSGLPTTLPSGMLRTVLGSIFTLESIFISGTERWRKIVPGHYFLFAINAMFWVTMLYAA